MSNRTHKWLIIAIAALLVLLGYLETPARSQQSVIIPATTNTDPVAGTVATITKLISGASGKRIYITAIGLHPAATSVVTLTTGTGTNCGTGPVVIYGPATFQASENWYQGTGNGAIMALPSGADLCITVGTAAAPGFISYTVF